MLYDIITKRTSWIDKPNEMFRKSTTKNNEQFHTALPDDQIHEVPMETNWAYVEAILPRELLVLVGKLIKPNLNEVGVEFDVFPQLMTENGSTLTG